MVAAVVYTSGTGFTERYAKWISSQLLCDCFHMEDVSAEMLRRYKVVLFGGWVQNGVITGLKKFLPMVGEKSKLVLFGVGMLPPSETVRNGLYTRNKIAEETPLFYFQGGYRPEVLGRTRKNPLRSQVKALEKADRTHKSEEVRFFQEHMGTSFDASSKSSTAELVSLAEQLKAAKPERSRPSRSDVQPDE